MSGNETIEIAFRCALIRYRKSGPGNETSTGAARGKCSSSASRYLLCFDYVMLCNVCFVVIGLYSLAAAQPALRLVYTGGGPAGSSFGVHLRWPSRLFVIDGSQAGSFVMLCL